MDDIERSERIAARKSIEERAKRASFVREFAKFLDANADEMTLETDPVGPFNDVIERLRVRVILSGEIRDFEVIPYEPGEPLRPTNIDEVAFEDWPHRGDQIQEAREE